MQAGRSLRRAARRLGSAAASLVALLAAAAGAQVTGQLVNGAVEIAEPTTGALIRGTPDSGYVTCSVVLVGCDVAITTAHCFNSNPQELQTVYFQHAGFIPIESATRHPTYVSGLPPTYDANKLRLEDIAFIKFAEPVTGITPSSLVGIDGFPLGTPGRIVGFGRDPITSVSAAIADYNAGIKRSGSMELAACEGSLAGQDVLCWHPPVPQGPTGEDVSTCDGDSGGPLFISNYDTRFVVGVTKGRVIDNQGQPDLCIPPVDPYDTSVYRHRGWLDGGTGTGGMVATTNATSLLTKQCSQLPQFSETVASGDDFGFCHTTPWEPGEQTRTCGFSGFLDVAGTATAMHSFDVQPGTALLRVGFNGIASSSGNVGTDYFLRAGAPATEVVYDCAAAGSGTLGSCEIQDPAAGAWYVLVKQTAYHGEYQVSVSNFADTSAVLPTVPALGLALRTGLLGLLFAATLGVGRRRTRGEGGPQRR